MVHGLPAKSKRSAVVQVDYLINVIEIKPWPPSQSLKSIRSVLIQWENGDKSSGSTNVVVPQLGSVDDEGKIEFNESFKLSMVLAREIGKGGDSNGFQKNCLEFNIYEPRREKTAKGQLLGTAVINLAEYGVIKDTLSLNAPVNCTRSYKNTAQPILYIEIIPAKKVRKHSTSEGLVSRELSMDKNDVESVSSMTKDECTEEAEIASFTDDDISSHSSTTVTSSNGDSVPENDESSYNSLKDGTCRAGISDHEESLKAIRSQSDVTTINESPESREKKNIAPNGNKDPRKFKGINTYSDPRIDKLQEKVKMLEEELREAAAVEVSLYSVVAEHGSSVNKLHAPARRLSRLYMHACKEGSRIRVARAAKCAASGLVLVAKACGNDVPRLTFWLSNCVMLRAIISLAHVNPEVPVSSRSISSKKSSSSLRSTDASVKINRNGNTEFTVSNDWMDSQAFTSALEKIESWVFSRIVESIWWQTLTPHMQSAAAKGIEFSKSVKSFGRVVSSSSGQDQGQFSLLLWKKAFKDACDRLCPIRAAGHECGCLPVLAKLVMEQCVARLDVAMFNAILRDSDDDIPTDPVSDPISDPRVLPIPVGKSCFGAGVQLKNVIGNWSRMFSEVFGIDEDDSIIDDQISIDDQQDMSFRSFNLLNTLSDLLMLPKDMLISKSIREEICPAFGPQLIKRILDTYVPDEFCPDPVPKEVLQALEVDAEDNLDAGQVGATNFPTTASPPAYMPPLTSSLGSYIVEMGKSQLTRTSSVLRKSYTSDDELDEIDSPLSSICLDGYHSPSAPAKLNHKVYGADSAIRYKLLRKVWEDSC